MQDHNGISKSIDPDLVRIMAIICGATVANLYYNQPLLGELSREFNVSVRNIGLVSTLTQIGYGMGMFFIIPLGDILERKNMILKLLLASVISLILFASSKNLNWLIVSSFLVGFTTVIPQLVVPFAAELSAPRERGKVLGTVLSGLLAGILLARTISGFLGALLGWRSVYYIASILMIVLYVVVSKSFPKNEPKLIESYKNIMISLKDLVKNEPLLREASLSGAMMFGAFSIFWTTLIFFLESPIYNMGSEAAGLFALLGISGVIAAPIIGRLSDKKSAKFAVGVSIFFAVMGFIVLFIFGNRIAGLILGLILLDLGTQSGQVSNQTLVHSLSPEARNRLNTVFMVAYFTGGALGSFAGTYSWNLYGWKGVCTAGLAFLTVAVINHVVHTKKILK
ncbi:MFS transporter [Clostridium sp. MT-14]|jgi:predicted MFS family arabinose efflux permease|uniref:MFS transporter n=1 Tax=Clostridium aromativorans TaxID=2836848 RepID=A0ABS8NAF8_9CLOT|nr:MFS transporter [Clostridium aromativorans]MCC9296641.1 MFS transporter [Clostridium aromativorans]CAB1251201.1 MFS domain-containing protein [Clostridiaceae bacterium BL-3]